jgi:hypothetical protein
MLTLIHDVLTDDENRQIINFFYQNPDSFWIDIDNETSEIRHFALKKILFLFINHMAIQIIGYIFRETEKWSKPKTTEFN